MKKITGIALAIIVGIIPGYFIILNSVFTDPSGLIGERIVTFIIAIAVYVLLGLMFGYLNAGYSWRWGLFLSAPAVLLLILYFMSEQTNIALNIMYILVTLASACGGAYLGAAFKKRRKAA